MTMEGSSTSPEKQFDSYGDWMRDPSNTAKVTTQCSVGSHGASLLHLSLSEVFSDPPTPDLTLQMCTGGSYWLRGDIGFGRFSHPKVETGIFGVAPANTPLELDGFGQFEMLILALPWAKVQPLAESIAGRDIPHFGALHYGMHRDATIANLMQSLWREQNRSGTNGALFADSITTALVAHLLRLSEGPPLPKETAARQNGLSKADVKRVTDYLHDHLSNDVSLDALAGVVCLSPFHFCRLFKLSTGLSPHQYVIHERVERAKVLLLNGDRPLTQVAVEVGFCDPAHLTRHMKRLLGVTPAQLRKR